MKKGFAFLLTMVLGAGLAVAQTGGDKKVTPQSTQHALNPQPLPPGRKATTQNKKAHKGGKKSKKGSSGGTVPPPK